MTVPAPPPTPEPPLADMSVAELTALAPSRNRYAGRAVFELARRARTDESAVKALGDLSHLQQLRDDRIFHLVSQAWAAIIGLLAAETSYSRQTAYAAFADLDPSDQSALLSYLKAERIEDAHPQL
jgi:uncharacterized membrane-anchored protein